MALPSKLFIPGSTVIPAKTFLVLTPAPGGVAGTPVPLVGKIGNLDDTIETVARMAPGADGVLRPDREEPISGEQVFTLEVEDVNEVPPIFDGGTTIGGKFAKGTCQIYVVDNDDAADTAAFVSNVFNSSWKLDGGLGLSHGEVSKVTIRVRALGQILLTPAGSTT